MMNGDSKKVKAAIVGRRNKEAGELWEKIISDSCKYYSDKGEAEIAKTPEPMRPIKRLGNGQFIAVFVKKAQPDYKGTLKDGNSIVFEAKHTDADRIRQTVITREQEEQLDKHFELGAECYVLISFGLQKFYKVPWFYFRSMHTRLGRRYLIPKDITKYEVKMVGGVLRFLYQ